MQFFTEPVLARLKFNCPKHLHSSQCQLCAQRQSDEPCNCEMCESYNRKHEQERTNRITLYLANKMTQKRQNKKLSCKHFQDVLHFLLYPHHKTILYPLGVFIPEICFYRDGEAETLYCNAEMNEKKAGIWPPAVLRIKKQKLNNTQIQKILNQKRRKYRDRISKAFNHEASKNKSIQRNSASQKDKKLDKFQTPKEKSQKNGRKRIFSLQKKQEVAPQPKDAVVICISNKDETYEQLREENYFIGLMLRRKQDPIFKPIDFIKNFVGIEDEDKHLIFCKHEQGKTKYKQLFERSKTIVKVMGTNIIPAEQKYITAEEEALFLLDLARKSSQQYAYYTLYKIISYVEFFHDEKITLISAKFLINQLKELYLIHVYSLKKHQLIKYTWNRDTYLQKIAQQENKILLRSPKRELDSHSQQKSHLIQKHMRGQYEELKTAMGLAEVQQNDQQQHKNNAFFAILYPQLPGTIGDILKDKSMTVRKFQRKYLGYQDKKKSVAVDFNSNLVKTLHNMTPQLKAAEGHEIQNKDFPKTNSAQTRSSVSKRSYSQGHTMSTLNRTTFFI